MKPQRHGDTEIGNYSLRNSRLYLSAAPAVKIMFLILVLVTVSLFFLPGCKKGEEEKVRSKASAKAIIRHGETVLTLDESAQEKSGLVVERLKAVFHQQEFSAYGTVLRPDALIDIRNSYLAAKSSSEKAAAVLDASRKEYERLRKLNEDNHNVSDKALQAARAALTSSEADVYAAEGRLQTIKQSALAQWGKALSEWIFKDSAEFSRLIDGEDVLVRVTLPPGVHIPQAPQEIGIQPPGGNPLPARFVTRALSTDPRIQGEGFIYLGPSNGTRLVPGMSIEARLPAGPGMKGVFVPPSAVVRRNGQAWAYVQESETRFVRRPVPMEYPLKDGYLAAGGFTPGELIVVKGAQMLLSMESLPGRHEEED